MKAVSAQVVSCCVYDKTIFLLLGRSICSSLSFTKELQDQILTNTLLSWSISIILFYSVELCFRHIQDRFLENAANGLASKDSKAWSIFCKTIYSFHKTGHKTIQKTNHYILLTNVSIKRCIKTSFDTLFFRGGRVPTRQVPYRQ